jgi:hypothetical protein
MEAPVVGSCRAIERLGLGEKAAIRRPPDTFVACRNREGEAEGAVSIEIGT